MKLLSLARVVFVFMKSFLWSTMRNCYEFDKQNVLKMARSNLWGSHLHYSSNKRACLVFSKPENMLVDSWAAGEWIWYSLYLKLLSRSLICAETQFLLFVLVLTIAVCFFSDGSACRHFNKRTSVVYSCSVWCRQSLYSLSRKSQSKGT